MEFLKAHLFVYTFSAIALLLCGCDTYGDETDPDSKVRIRDKVFLDRLIDAGVDKDGDGKISYAEAEKVYHLDVSVIGFDRIKRLDGIEAFVNLRTLDCSANTHIRYLDISNFASLRYLDCELNNIKTLDPSNNTALTYLNCYENELESLDLKSNTALEFLNCNSNRYMEYLDISNCNSLKQLSIVNIFDLTVCIWETFWSDSVEIYTSWMQGVNYTTDCP